MSWPLWAVVRFSFHISGLQLGANAYGQLLRLLYFWRKFFNFSYSVISEYKLLTMVASFAFFNEVLHFFFYSPLACYTHHIWLFTVTYVIWPYGSRRFIIFRNFTYLVPLWWLGEILVLNTCSGFFSPFFIILVIILTFINVVNLRSCQIS